ncbi:MAG: MFS transporter [Planctomycetota bacterium]
MRAHPPANLPTDAPLPWSHLIAYGMGGLIPIALFNIAGQLMGLLGNVALGLSAFWLGTIMILPRLWDAISDPIMGHLSDNARTRYGRRRPFILIGGLSVALSFVAMWWIPRGDFLESFFPSEAALDWFQLAFILVGLLIFFTSCTVFEIPHGALGMEMSDDYHERTRLFSAKSFLGNLFAMGTPWLLYLAGRDFFKGPGGDLADGMRYVSLFVALALVPLVIWWFIALKEPAFAAVRNQAKTRFGSEMRTAFANKTFLKLVLTIFILAMGFNFVALFNYYITIFYLYGGDAVAAGPLLGINGTAWAVTGLVAVFPLNWLSRQLGKSRTLVIAILLMCLAQLSKIVCYDPAHPYLLLIPTVLLSAGMLMFFTLGASMVGDVCDEDELERSTRAEGSYYSVYWWFIKMGTAFASFVTGALIVGSGFDEQQNVQAESVNGKLAELAAAVEVWDPADEFALRAGELQTHLSAVQEAQGKLLEHVRQRTQADDGPELTEAPSSSAEVPAAGLLSRVERFGATLTALQASTTELARQPDKLRSRVAELQAQAGGLRRQASQALFRLRLIEIGLPLVTSVFSILLMRSYPLSEARCQEIKAALAVRREATTSRPVAT